jgi:alpha-1,3-rhamnosyl/mannosyltransferase
MALHAAAIVICISEATRSDLESRLHVTPSRLVVIREGAGESFRPSRNEEVHRLLDKYQIPDPYLLYVGSNKPHKNLPVLIESFAQLRTPISLVLAGNMDPRFDLAQRKIEEIGIGSRIRFLGAVKEDELPALYSGARAFVFPSLQEGFGLPPLEAIACGTPAVCSDIPSLRETMGSAALFFDPKDRESLASALNRIATDESLRADLQTRGLQRAAELNWNVAAKKTMEVYRSLAGSG